MKRGAGVTDEGMTVNEGVPVVTLGTAQDGGVPRRDARARTAGQRGAVAGRPDWPLRWA